MEATQLKPDPDRSAPTPEKVKDGQSLEIAIKGQDGAEVKFRVKSNTPFQKVFNAWAKRKGVSMEQYRFLTSEGQRIKPEDTPAFHNMDDGETIDAMVNQEGGHVAADTTLKL